MKRPPWGAEKREDYLSFCPFLLCLSLCLSLHLSLSLSPSHCCRSSPLNQLRQAHRAELWLAPPKRHNLGVFFFFPPFAGGNRRRRAMRHSCDGCHCGTALAISLPSSSFIIHTVIYFNKWRGACSSLACPRWHEHGSLSLSVPSVCCIKRKLFMIAQFSWLGFSVSHSPESI